jgi:hypothetical protein
VAEVKFFWENPIEISLIAEAWQTAFDREFNLNDWHWRFPINSAETPVHAAYMIEDRNIICFVTHSPLTAVIPSGDKLRAGLMLAGFTHPHYQGRGLFTDMSKAVNIKLKKAGFDFIFAFANHNSHYTNRRYLGWEDIAILTNFRLEKSQLKTSKVQNELFVRELEFDSALMQTLSTFVVCKDKYHFERSFEFLIWRLVKHPTHKYRAAGIFIHDNLKAVAIYKQYLASEADIMEIFWYDVAVIGSYDILSAMVSFLLDSGFSALNLWSNLRTEEHLNLEKIGFREAGFSAYFGMIKLNSDTVSIKAEDWHYRFLDSDVF